MEQVIEIVKKTFLQLFDRFRQNKRKLREKAKHFQMQNQNYTTSPKNKRKFPRTASNCPYCNQNPMKLVTTYKKKRFLACIDDKCIEKSKSYLSVPKHGRIYILKTTFCSICGFNVFKIHRHKNGKSFNYYMCPLCWNRGLKKNNSQGFCSNCKEYKIKKEKNGIKCIKKT
jgi:hypothetical protein